VITTPDGKPLDLTMTTNASLLAKKAQSLKDAGLKRVTVSLDSLDETTFQRMNDVDFPVADVLHGIEVAQKVGLGPIKVNMVVKGGTLLQRLAGDSALYRIHGCRCIQWLEDG
jgi:cyclic pyranopterin phosphate synthase